MKLKQTEKNLLNRLVRATQIVNYGSACTIRPGHLGNIINFSVFSNNPIIRWDHQTLTTSIPWGCIKLQDLEIEDDSLYTYDDVIESWSHEADIYGN